MSGSGRPLRFLGVVLGGWTVVRVALVWPQVDSLPSLVSALVPPVAASTHAFGAVSPAPADATVAKPPVGQVPTRIPPRTGPAVPVSATPVPVSTAPPSAPPPRADELPVQPPPLRPAPLATPPDRLALSAWLIARGGQRGALSGGQLGASQAGARLTYALGHRVALAARVSAPIEGRGKEAALGLDWQPTAMPLHVVAEQRFSLDGGRGGPTLFLIGGIDPTAIALGFRLDAYGQAGGIARGGRVDAFADGAARLLHPLALVGRARVELGGGAWGGAQRGAARLDVGPSAAVIVPLSGRSVRVALDWRQRVAGRARPGSGPALSIGGDF